MALSLPLAALRSGHRAQLGCASPSPHACLACLCVCFCVCVCITLEAHRCFLQSPALSLCVCMCLLAFPHLSIPVHISIHYNNPLSRSHFSACDLSGSEFSTHGSLLLHPHGCSEGARRAKLGRGTHGVLPDPPPRAPHSREEWRGQQGTKQEDEKVKDSQEAGSGPQQTSGDNTTPRKDGTPGETPQRNQTTPLWQLSRAQIIVPAVSCKVCQGPCYCRAHISLNKSTHTCAL